MSEFAYVAPADRTALLAALAEPGARLLAGGTDLLVNVRLGLVRPTVVVDLKRVPGYDAISFSKADGLSIGPAVTVNALLESDVVRAKYPLLRDAAHELASHPIRHRATVVGNICNASPCADMAPPLLCLDARVVAASRAGRKETPLRDFFTGVKTTSLGPGEFVERLVVPAASAGARGGFLKHKRVKGHDIGVVSVCVARVGKVLRVAVGSAAPTPVVAETKASAGPADVVRAARKVVKPIDDVRGSAAYRLHLMEVFIERIMREMRR